MADAISARPTELILGYTTPLSARPGGRIEVRVSSSTGRYDASLVRLLSAGPGDGVRHELVRDLGSRECRPHKRAIRTAGSSVAVGPSEAFRELGSFTVSIWVWPSLLTETPQALLGTLTADGTAGWAVILDRERGVGLRVAAGSGIETAYSKVPLRVREWSHLLVSLDGDSGRVRISRSATTGGPHTAEAAVRTDGHRGADTISIAAPIDGDRPVSAQGNGCFNGKLASPIVYGTVLDPDRADQARAGVVADPAAPVVCRLDLAEAIDGAEFRDRSPARHPAVMVNQPTPGVTGPTWRGHSSTYVEARAEYSAIHFHDDDLEDAGWEVGVELELEPELKPGIYAARLVSADCEDLVPFYVTAPRVTTADALLLLPTLTYLAYANEHEILSNPPSYTAFTGKHSEDAPLGWRDWLAVEEGLLSLYDVHRDGSSVSYASTKRPLLNVRPDYVWPLLEGPHGLAMDLRLSGWLGREGFEYDLLTDHDLDAHGREALDPYRVVITGGHPEYWTGDMLDALDGYLGSGGRLVYLGGNGLHGVTGIDRERPHVAEVRRPLVGSRPSSAAPGELWMTTRHEEGGTWRARGRSSHRFVGVGTTAMGAGPGRPYERTAASYEPAYSWVFDGIDGGLVGEGGFLNGGAAYEFDRADPELGTPEHAEVLASASGFTDLYFPMLEDFGASCPEVADPGSPLVRADMVMMVGDGGGGVFSVGSAAWCGGLEEPGDPSVSTVTGNVLRRFVETPRGEDPRRPGAGQ